MPSKVQTDACPPQSLGIYSAFMDRPNGLPPVRDVTAASRLLTLVGIVVVIAGLYFGRQVLIPMALAVVLAFLLTPLVGLLEKSHLGRVPSVLAALVLSFALLAAVGWGVTNQLMAILDHLPDYKTNIRNKIAAVRAPGSGSLGKATATVNDLSKELSTASETAEDKKLGKNGGKQTIAVQVAVPPQNAAQYLRDVIGPLTGILETAGIVVIFDSADGGMVAATMSVLKDWRAGTLSDSALWHKCFFDPPETFESSGASGQ